MPSKLDVAYSTHTHSAKASKTVTIHTQRHHKATQIHQQGHSLTHVHTHRQTNLNECGETEATILVLFSVIIWLYSGSEPRSGTYWDPTWKPSLLTASELPSPFSRNPFPTAPLHTPRRHSYSYYFLCAGVYLLFNICSHLDCGLLPLAWVPNSCNYTWGKRGNEQRGARMLNVCSLI